MNQSSLLLASYQLYPQREQSIVGGRGSLSVLESMMRGLELEKAANRVGNIFTLCSQSHKVLCDWMINTIKAGQVSHLSTNDQALMRWTVIKDHIQRMALDWPRLLALDERLIEGFKVFLRCPLWKMTEANEQSLESLRQWFSQEVLGMDIHAWWDNWHTSGTAWLNSWSSSQQSFMAQTLEQQGFLKAWAQKARFLEPQSINWLALNSLWSTDPGWSAFPTLEKISLETGPVARLNRYVASTTKISMSAWLRLFSRLIEVVGMLLNKASTQLNSACYLVDKYAAIAWVEMGRGVLVHRLQVDTACEHIQDYAVLAPTEWNYHPQGQLAQCLSREIKIVEKAQINALACAFDPCIAFSVQDSVQSQKTVGK